MSSVTNYAMSQTFTNPMAFFDAIWSRVWKWSLWIILADQTLHWRYCWFTSIHFQSCCWRGAESTALSKTNMLYKDFNPHSSVNGKYKTELFLPLHLKSNIHDREFSSSRRNHALDFLLNIFFLSDGYQWVVYMYNLYMSIWSTCGNVLITSKKVTQGLPRSSSISSSSSLSFPFKF